MKGFYGHIVKDLRIILFFPRFKTSVKEGNAMPKSAKKDESESKRYPRKLSSVT